MSNLEISVPLNLVTIKWCCKISSEASVPWQDGSLPRLDRQSWTLQAVLKDSRQLEGFPPHVSTANFHLCFLPVSSYWVERYKLQNSAGALIFHADQCPPFFGGSIVVDDSSYKDILRFIENQHSTSIAIQLSASGLEEAVASAHHADTPRRATIEFAEFILEYACRHDAQLFAQYDELPHSDRYTS